jgi:peptidoglycan-associated lipoprotein
MITKSLKHGLTLAVIMSFLVGCSSSSTQDDDASANTAPVVTENTGSGIEEQAPLESIVYFDFDQATLKPETRALLLAHSERLKASGASARLEGHADERGSREYNIALGERRANAVRDFLVLQGVSASSLEVVSYGEERPMATGSDESSYSQNRRVEVKY